MNGNDAKNWGTKRVHHLVVLICTGGVALVLAVGLAGAASTGGHHEKLIPAPVDIMGLHGSRTLKAGFRQHVPTNLGGLRKPKAAGTSGARRLSAMHAGRSGVSSPSALRSLAALPGAPVITSQPTNPTFATAAAFSFTYTGQTAAFQCRLDSASFAACTSPASYPGPLSFGSHTFRVRATNANGTSATTQYSWTVSPPPAPTLDSTPPTSTADASATFSFSDTLADVSFECRLDGAAFAACTSPKSYGPLAYGTHTFRVQARDVSGTGPATVFSWTISRAPAPTLTATPATQTTDRSASFSFTDSQAGATYQCRLDGSSFVSCTSPQSYAGPLSYGAHTFRVQAVFSTGTSIATVYSWSIVPPTPTINTYPGNPTTATSATLSFSDSASNVTFVCRLDGAAFAACTSPKSYTTLAVATHTFEVRAVTGNGTQSASASYAWSIVPPPPTITSSPQNPSSSTSAAFAFTDTDVAASFECEIDAAAFVACTSPVNYALLSVGDHTFLVRAKDAGGTSAATSYSWTISTLQVKMRLLVISGNGTEQYDFASNSSCSPNPCKGAIQSYLEGLGVPYDTMIASQTDPTTLADKLGLNGSIGNYDGIILATGNLAYIDSAGSFVSGFTADEWQTLWSYESKFHVRQVTSFTYPSGPPDDYGLTYAGETGDPIDATLTTAGKQVFSYLNPDATIKIRNAYVYLATTSDPSVTPLVTSGDKVIASTRTYADGRENLAVTAANAPWALHTKLLSYGIVNWVTRGLFLGSRHVTMDAEVDDLLINSDIWNPTTHSDAENQPTSMTYRISPADFAGAAAWQSAKQGSNPNLAQLRLEFAFNGEGAFGDPPDYSKLDGSASIYQPDPLTPAVVQDQANFCYINHTYQHQNVDLTNYNSSLTQISENQRAARALGFGCYSDQEFVQPDISGLTNSTFLQAAWDSGVRYLITDTSQPGWSNPSPNAGFMLGAPGNQLLALPRHPSNLFYNLQTRDQWVDEYNWYYCLCSPSNSTWKTWSTPLDYAQILDVESDNLLSYLLSWDIDPLMFHQANLGLYDGQHSLLSDLLDATLQKYVGLYNLPILNRTQQQVGDLMRQRMAYDASGVEATIVPCQTVTLTVQHSASIPITGLTAGTTETYGGQPISTVQVNAGSPLTLPVSCS